MKNKTLVKIYGLRIFAALLLCTGMIMSALVAHLPAHDFAPQGQVMASRAVTVQIYHGLAFLIVSLMLPRPFIGKLSILGLVLGTVLFCSSVYFRAFTGHHLSHLAPTGGSLLILSWFLLGLSWCVELCQLSPKDQD